MISEERKFTNINQADKKKHDCQDKFKDWICLRKSVGNGFGKIIYFSLNATAAFTRPLKSGCG